MQMYLEDKPYNAELLQLIGVHAGFGQDAHFGTVITETLLKDFLIPTIEIYEYKADEIVEEESREFQAVLDKPISELCQHLKSKFSNK